MNTSQQKLSKEMQIAELAAKSFASHKIEQRLYQFESFDRYYGHWVCTKEGKGSNVYRFDIQHKPGTLTVTGDIGDLMVERTSNMVAWCRGSVGSIGYFAEKVPSAIQTREKSPDMMQEYVDTMLLPDPSYSDCGTYNKWGQQIVEKVDCPKCHGYGEKEGDESNNYDWVPCETCKGKGEVLAEISSEWVDLQDEVAHLTDGPPDVLLQALYESTLCNDCDWMPDLSDWTTNFLWCREAVKWFCENWDGPNPNGSEVK